MILFDFPFEPSEYIRRVGRTGRAGRKGKATVLVYGKQVQAAKAVLQASISGKAIDPSLEDDADEADEKSGKRVRARGQADRKSMKYTRPKR